MVAANEVITEKRKLERRRTCFIRSSLKRK
jgi:hypothetical protein